MYNVYPNDADLDGTGSTSELLEFDYDPSGRVTEIDDPGGSVIALAQYRYAGPGAPVREVKLYKGGFVTTPALKKTVSYDHLKRPVETEYLLGTGETRRYEEGWGDGGWTDPGETERVGVFARATLRKLRDTTELLAHDYRYDALSRLVSFDAGATTFEYDGAQNRLRKNTTTYTYNASNEVTGISGFCALAHDPRGNLKRKRPCGGAKETFSYDTLNRLVSYNNDESLETWEVTYDALGRRVKKERTDVPKERYYFYDGPQCVLELRDTGTVEVREYLHGVGIDEVVVELVDGVFYWPLVDTLGTVRDLVDLDGAALERVRVEYDYSPYGILVQETDTQGQGFEQDVLFTGRRLDRESGVYYYRARRYDPELGRFMQRDPIGVWEDQESIGNPYGYVSNRPTDYADPLGLSGDFGDPDAKPLTKKMCRDACKKVFKKESARQICYQMCKRFKGKTCEALLQYCKHLARHPGGYSLHQACMAVYTHLCILGALAYSSDPALTYRTGHEVLGTYPQAPDGASSHDSSGVDFVDLASHSSCRVGCILLSDSEALRRMPVDRVQRVVRKLWSKEHSGLRNSAACASEEQSPIQ